MRKIQNIELPAEPDTEAPSTKAPDTEVLCQCEAEGHFENTRHPYLGVPAGSRSALYVGRVCDPCATDCVDRMLKDGRQDIEWPVEYEDEDLVDPTRWDR